MLLYSDYSYLNEEVKMNVRQHAIEKDSMFMLEVCMYLVIAIITCASWWFLQDFNTGVSLVIAGISFALGLIAIVFDVKEGERMMYIFMFVMKCFLCFSFVSSLFAYLRSFPGIMSV